MVATVFLSLCVGSIFLLSFICFLNPGKANNSANHWLAVFLFCFGFALLSDLCQILGVSQQYPMVVVLSEMTRLAMAPSLYLSILFFTTPDRVFRRKDLIHFILFLMFIINCAPLLIDNSPIFSNRFDSTEAGKYIRLFMFLVIKVQVVLYWVVSYYSLVRHQKNIKRVFSSLGPVNLKWINYFLLSLLLAVVIWFNQQFFGIQWINDYSSLGYLIVIYTLGYFIIKQKEVFHFPANDAVDILNVIENKELPRQERLPSAELESLSAKLNQLMKTEKCYLNPELELPELASRMNLTSHELSYLLNKGLGCNFFEFVNKYRVEEAKTLLLSLAHQHLNILGIAYESGFNSKTTFNTTFKKVTGFSPSQFRKLNVSGNQQVVIEAPCN